MEHNNQKQQHQHDNSDSNKKESTNSGGNDDNPKETIAMSRKKRISKLREKFVHSIISTKDDLGKIRAQCDHNFMICSIKAVFEKIKPNSAENAWMYCLDMYNKNGNKLPMLLSDLGTKWNALDDIEGVVKIEAALREAALQRC